jgi:hypothetical protein
MYVIIINQPSTFLQKKKLTHTPICLMHLKHLKTYTGCIWNTCVNFNQWKNSPIYETFLYNILQNSQKISTIFLPPSLYFSVTMRI